MSVIFVLIIASLLVAVGFLAAFFWALRNSQYNDTFTPGVRMLFDDGLNDEGKINNMES